MRTLSALCFSFLLACCSTEQDEVWYIDDPPADTVYDVDDLGLPESSRTPFDGIGCDEGSGHRGCGHTTEASHTTVTDTKVRKRYDTVCQQDLKYVNENLDKDWAKQMMDATTHVNFEESRWLFPFAGNMEYCRRVIVPSETDPSVVRFRGKYCYLGRSVKILNQQTLYIMTDACFPDTCDLTELSNPPRELIEPWMTTVGMNLNWTHMNTYCRDLTKHWGAGAVTVLFVMTLLVLLVVAGTTITLIERWYLSRYSPLVPADVSDGLSVEGGYRRTSEQSSLLNRNEDQLWNRLINFLKCFSAITNATKIFSVTVVKQNEPLLCLHGIRFIAMTWVILIHTYNNTFTMVDPEEFSKTMYLMNNWEFQIIIQASFAVDTFFFLSGFLVTHVFLKEVKASDGKMSWLYFYVHRYWRLTPTYALVLGFNTVVVPLLYIPFFVKMEKDVCKWWVNLLYLNNVVNVGKTCMSWTWYLANDMQFYVISPIFLYPLWRWPRIGVGIILVMTFSSCLLCGALTYQYDLIPGYTQLSETKNFTAYVPRTTEYFITLYNKPWARIQPYLVGALLAYILYQQVDKKIVLTPWSKFFGWVVATIIAVVDVYGVHGTHPDIAGRVFYNAFTHFAFAVALAWVVYSCLTGYGGIVNRILSNEMFMPLSRLTYCAYLLHPVYMLVYYDSLRTPFYMNHLTLVTLFFSFLFVAYIFALIAALLVESPMMALEKLVVKRK